MSCPELEHIVSRGIVVGRTLRLPVGVAARVSFPEYGNSCPILVAHLDAGDRMSLAADADAHASSLTEAEYVTGTGRSKGGGSDCGDIE